MIRLGRYRGHINQFKAELLSLQKGVSNHEVIKHFGFPCNMSHHHKSHGLLMSWGRCELFWQWHRLVFRSRFLARVRQVFSLISQISNVITICLLCSLCYLNLGDMCEKSNACLFWTFNYNDLICYLKTSDDGLQQKAPGHYSGVKGCK